MGMNHSSGDADDLITEINVTPFVDVVLVLLIIFMLAAPAVYQAAIPVQLPRVASAKQIKHVTLQIYVSDKGQITLDREKVSAASIKDIVKKALTLDSNADAMISADTQVSHGVVMGIVSS